MASQYVSSSTVGIISDGDGIVNIGRDLVVGSYLEESYEELDPPRESKVFKGREKDLLKLEALFFQDGKRKVVIFGLPGFGKSELANQFAKRCTDSTKIDKVFWINAETPKNLQELQRTLKKIYKTFKNKRCLFIFDNGVSRRSIAKYEPPEVTNFFLLITSQIADWGDDIIQISLKPLNMEASIDVFREILGGRYQTDKEYIYKEMTEFVSNAPLGLIVISGHLRFKTDACKQKEFDINRFLQQISTMLKKEIHYSLSTAYERSMYAAMAVCLDRMLNQDYTESEHTREVIEKILVICAYLNPEHIHIKIISEIMEHSEEITMDEYVYLLENFSFIEYYDGEIKIHRLCQRILKLYFNEIKKDCYSACARWLFRQEYELNWHEKTILMEADDHKEIINEIIQENVSKNKYTENVLTLLAQYGCCKCCELIFQNITLGQRKLHVDRLLSKYSGIIVNLQDTEVSNLGVVRVLPEKDGNVHARDNEGLALLKQWNVDVVQMLLEKEGDANVRDRYGCTPLHQASYIGHVDMVRMLLDKGGDVHARDSQCCTPLHTATQKENENTVRMLLEKGSDVHAQDSVGYTPLHKASWNRNTEIVRMLLEKGGDVHARDNEHRTPLHFASFIGNVDIVQMLLKKRVDIHAQDNEGCTPLQWASQAQVGNGDIVRMLLEQGGDVHAQNNKGYTPLHWASQKGNVDIVQILLQKGNVNARDNEGRIPLHWASEDGNKDIVQMLLKKGGDVLARDNEGLTPLHSAENLEVIQMLLEKGDVHAQDNKGRTPLHWASWRENLEVLRILLENGGDANNRDNEGCTPLHKASQNGNVNIVRILLEKRGDVHARDSDGRAPLHLACGARNEDVVRMLLQKGGHVDAGDNYGTTPLHVASFTGNIDIVQVLLAKVGDVNVHDNMGFTPLHDASWQENVGIVRMLLEKGGDIDARDNRGRTPLDWATLLQQTDIINMLQQLMH